MMCDTMENEKTKRKYVLLKNTKVMDWCFASSINEAEKYFAKKHILKKGYYEIYKLMLYLKVE
jgi:hypothetical protein